MYSGVAIGNKAGWLGKSVCVSLWQGWGRHETPLVCMNGLVNVPLFRWLTGSGWRMITSFTSSRTFWVCNHNFVLNSGPQFSLKMTYLNFNRLVMVSWLQRLQGLACRLIRVPCLSTG